MKDSHALPHNISERSMMLPEGRFPSILKESNRPKGENLLEAIVSVEI
jgi:hypothetical protein